METQPIHDTLTTTGACVLVADGEARARLVLTPAARADYEDAVQELITGIAKATGARLYIAQGAATTFSSFEPVYNAPVAVTFTPCDRQAALGKDGFRIRATETSLEFAAENRAGFFNAVCTFLEQHCGFRWFWPGPDGEVHDTLDRLCVPVGETTETPDYQWRHLLLLDMPIEDGTAPGKWQAQEFYMRQSPANTALMVQWLQRNRMGGLKVLPGHTWGRFVSPYEFGREHPDYFAEIRGARENSLTNFSGKHGAQLCTSNPGVIDLMVRRVREHFDQHPDVDVISISPNDGTALCECDACIARDIHYGNPPPGTGGAASRGLDGAFKDDADTTTASKRITGPITDRMFEFANKIAAAIAESHPDKKLLLLVYGPYREPPRQVRLADNVIAQFCVSCHEHWNPTCRQADRDAITTLAAKAGATGIYEYYDQGAWPGVTRSFPDLISDSVRFFHQHGVRHYSAQASTGFAANGFNVWFLARALWNTAVTVDAALEEYCRKAFGGAAEPMRRYFDRWRSRWRECEGISRMDVKVPAKHGGAEPLAPFEQILKLYPPAFMAGATGDLDAARALVAPEAPERRRIDFCAKACQGAQIILAAAAYSYALRDCGWPMTRESSNKDNFTREALSALGPAAQVRSQAQTALRLWARWEAYLEAHRDDFIFSFFWARYCYEVRKPRHPHYALQQILDLLDDVGPCRRP